MALPMTASRLARPAVFRCVAASLNQYGAAGARPHRQNLSTGVSEAKDVAFTVRSQTEQGVRTILLNDPKRRNALSLDMLQSLKEDLMHQVGGEDLRAIVIASSGPVFSSGHNLKELTTEHGRDFQYQVMKTCSQVMMLVQDMPVPVIAQVQGLATAAGCQLVASCDIAVASENARFATPGVNIGLFCSTPGVALGRAVPRKLAMEMLFTGEPISADVALKHGLVSKVVPHDSLEEETNKLTDKICTASRSVIALGKACFNSQMKKTRAEAYGQASEVMVQNLGLVDGQEGIQAFIEKRKPVWTHNFDKV
ncbi:enoyl-CoA hydratase domain-containing protein 3, mitochondrial-like isoform X2 [Patiria miniata]|uniref:Enoyl-CoA hydratase domain-containing protein 3, mitochondrial n=1 Tax=Patiria miniata TaxID=46514 RepID=A0A913ZKR7_PATMI|nr:enoyl-CoA hydratase domain-containing protein 3, mitochondrial-like isoform X2 [Patiria miniata]